MDTTAVLRLSRTRKAAGGMMVGPVNAPRGAGRGAA